MMISVGDKLPETNLQQIGADGPQQVSLASKLAGRKVVIFGLPGAFTSTCTSAHLPSFMRTKEKFAAKGVDEIICIAVNDPYVMKAWGESTGAVSAGITMLADGQAELTMSLGLDFSAPAIGFLNRSKRYALYAEDGVVKILHLEEKPGVCEATGGEAMLAAI